MSFDKFQMAYMNVAFEMSKLSHAVRLKAGALIVKDRRILSFGYNGTPSGWDNTCEDKVYLDTSCPASWGQTPEQISTKFPYSDEKGHYRLVTRPEVLHAESNAITKLAASHENGCGGSMYITDSPCMECAKLILQTGLTHVYYKRPYRITDGIDLLKRSGVTVQQM